MSILSKLQSLEGAERYEYFVEVCHRSTIFDEEYPDYYPVDFQYEDWLSMDDPGNRESCYVRACGGSKTFDGVIWSILRATLYPNEHGAWLASFGGQLTQARRYFKDNPFVKKITGGKGEEVIHLFSGAEILFRGATKSITGIRLDWILLDEEEMLEENQIELVYPQLHGRLTKSKIGKFFHLGTMQYATLFMENIDRYQSFIHDWTQCPWLVETGQIQGYIDNQTMPEFEINMLYRCIPDVPGGSFFNNIKEIDPYEVNWSNVLYGMDFGNIDHCCGVIVDKILNKCTIVVEYERDLEMDNTAYDFLKGSPVESEGGGYNDDSRYSAKSQLMVQRIGASRVPMTTKFKHERKLIGRGFSVIEIFSTCKKTLLDMRSCQFGPDSLWLKDRKHPCHKVDTFFHAIGARSRGSYVSTASHKYTLLRDQKRRTRYVKK